MSLIQEHRLAPVRYSNDIVVSSCGGREDVLLWRAFQEITAGFYVDIGAGDPNWGSPTRWFYVNGWSGINIEPHPVLFPILQKWRPRDININCGISDIEGELCFYKVDPDTKGVAWGLSSFSLLSANEARKAGHPVTEMRISTVTLDRVYHEHCIDRDIDLLKVDVEGYEAAVIASADWRKFRPKILCIEATEPCSPNPSFGSWEYILINADYNFVLFDGINNYYVRAESPELRSQFNCGLNSNDRFRPAVREDMREPWLY